MKCHQIKKLRLYRIRKAYNKNDLPMILWRSCWQWYWCSRTCPFLGQKQNTSPFFWGKCIARNSYRQKIHISGHVCSVKHRQDYWRRRLLRIGPDFKEFVLQLLAKSTIVFFFRINTITWTREIIKKKRERMEIVDLDRIILEIDTILYSDRGWLQTVINCTNCNYSIIEDRDRKI